MHRFAAEQKTVDIGGIKLGGQIGENPIVMIGSIFYRGHDIVTDAEKGEFDKLKAEELIKRQEEMSASTGIPAMYDVVSSSPTAAASFMEFVADRTEKPLLFDAIGTETALKGLNHLSQVGLGDRIVFNSISADTKQDVMSSLEKNKIKSVILLTYSAKALTSSMGRVKLAVELLRIAEQIGISKALVDTVVLDPPTLGMASNAIFEVKDKIGVPAGCGAHNAISQFESRLAKQRVISCQTSSCILPAALGADFILYGPIESADYIFPAVALVAVGHRQLCVESGGKLDTSRPSLRIGL
jgi:tetrahydromethanopterin S-methyltransferase subunit H